MIGKIHPNADCLIEGGQQRLEEARRAPPLAPDGCFEAVDSSIRITHPTYIPQVGRTIWNEFSMQFYA
jgi:hypothetical protein